MNTVWRGIATVGPAALIVDLAVVPAATALRIVSSTAFRESGFRWKEAPRNPDPSGETPASLTAASHP